MIDFACKTFKLEEVIKCGLGLTRSEFDIFSFFIENKNKSFTTLEISKNISLDISTVQRAVKKLHGLNALSRSQINIKEGGYQFVYQIRPKKEIRLIILSVIENWSKRVEVELESWI